MSEEWLEIRARSQEDAIEAAADELGLDSVEQVHVVVVEEPEKGILGFGGKDGLFRVSKKRSNSRRRRRRSRGGRSSSGKGSNGGDKKPRPKADSQKKPSGEQRREQNRKPRPDRRPNDDRRAKPAGKSASARPERVKEPKKEEGAVMPDLEEQAAVVDEFLVGLLDAFGLEGSVDTRVEGEDIIISDVTGEQAEALIGPKGSILQAILELTRTVVQRKTQAGARIRLDIGGYAQRRREALKIYAGRLAEQVLEDQEEVMLEPMNPADRKAVHDVIAEIDGVRSYSEGEEPRRSVVISPAPAD